jgi:hypothetical protein
VRGKGQKQVKMFIRKRGAKKPQIKLKQFGKRQRRDRGKGEDRAKGIN